MRLWPGYALASCFLVVTISMGSCKPETDYSKNYYNSEVLAFEHLKQCVDTILKAKPSINTKNYVLDVGGIDSLNRKGVDSFLNIKNITLPTTIDDSTMIFIDKNPENFTMKQSMIVKIRSISFRDKKRYT